MKILHVLKSKLQFQNVINNLEKQSE